MIAIKDNIENVELQIYSACKHAERDRAEVILLAVSKTKPAKMITAAYQCGLRHFGESYVQEAEAKISLLKNHSDIVWHFIGPIQSNKTATIAKNFAWVHSLDRIKIAKRLNNQRTSQQPPLNVCIQVNISGEASKSGVTLDSLAELLAVTASLENLTLRGLMAIPEKQASQASFDTMQQLFLTYQKQYPSMDTLSMGMSADLATAIQSGSTVVRIGSAIFGQRNTVN